MFKKNPDTVFRNVKGVIHVGANTGQEIELYAKHGLLVIWIEPNPEAFETLKANLKDFPEQIAIMGLVTDLDNAEYPFHLANNSESSSILELNLHHDIWPEVKYEKTINILSSSLPSLLKDNDIDHRKYDMLVMDTQGSELLVLKGATPILEGFTYIKAEVPDFESYKGCCQVEDLHLFLENHGFKEYTRHRFAKRRGGGSYYDIVYKKK
ncbi:FkbM family methyltransferase [Flavitalea flava]